MVWECPVCGVQLAQMTGTPLDRPRCDDDHEPVEMEQRLSTRWGVSS